MTLIRTLTLPALLIGALIVPMAAQAEDMAPPLDMAAPGMAMPGMGQPGMGHPGMGPGGMPHASHPGPRPGPPLGLELSEAQQDKAFALKHAQEPLQRELMKAVHKAREAMHSMVKAGDFDEKKAAALADNLGKATAALELHQARSHAQFIALLTPEQRKTLAAERPMHAQH